MRQICRYSVQVNTHQKQKDNLKYEMFVKVLKHLLIYLVVNLKNKYKFHK